MEMFCNIINVFTVTFDHFNVLFLNKIINFSVLTEPKHLNRQRYLSIWPIFLRQCVYTLPFKSMEDVYKYFFFLYSIHNTFYL